jgi:hypothetical protein
LVRDALLNSFEAATEAGSQDEPAVSAVVLAPQVNTPMMLLPNELF